uniref:Digestive organ expansion factor homolog n=1 Tax=Glossina brevipalpis TaxID=37001 RepID=A0A1A9W105_9MUSC
MGKKFGHFKKSKTAVKDKNCGKKQWNGKFKQRSSAAVEVLKKQIDLEKKVLKYQPTDLRKITEQSAETEDHEDDFQSLVNELSAATKKQPSFKELKLLGSKPKNSSLSGQKSKLNQSEVSNENEKHLHRLLPPFNRFKEHLQHELSSEDVEKLIASGPIDKLKKTLEWSQLKYLHVFTPNIKDNSTLTHINEDPPKTLKTASDLESVGVQPSLANKVPTPLNELQSELFSIINVYKDIYYPHRNLVNGEEVRLVYTLHAFNHILKTRACVMLNNKKIEEGNSNNGLVLTDAYRDQGLVRPKVLIIVPFRNSVYRIISLMANIVKAKASTSSSTENDQKTVMNYERFLKEFTGDSLYFPKTNPKPEDYEKTFTGNTDDNFRLGLSLTKKTLKLYTDFYSSDILIASPLGLRVTMGGSSDSDAEHDFLSSIEVLIIDQAELILAQNWENLLHILEHMHLQPKTLRATDINRVRMWCLNGFSKFYRQTLMFASHELPEFRGVFSNKCCNYEGCVRISKPVHHGEIHNVLMALPQVFQRIDVNGLENIYEQRLHYFINKVLPQFKSSIFAHTMIYVPNYFDYVQLRNYFKAENLNFVQICEYTKKEKIARARDMFFHSAAHFLLYSERSHFFKRTRVKGIRHLIMYQPPTFPHFYAEMINLMHSSNQNARDGLDDSMSITVLYTKYDQLVLNGILGSENTTKLLESDKPIHVYTAQ